MRLALAIKVTANFDRAMEHCDNLVRVHQRAGGDAKGRRREEISVNRAIVVIAVASWQAVVQDMTKFLLEQHMPEASDSNHGVAQLLRGHVLGELRKFSTPNAENTRQLLQSVGYDPRPHWTWTNGAHGSRAITYRPHDIEDQLRDWLKIRHAIAHGDERMPEVSVLQAVREGSTSTTTGPTVRLADARACIAFIRTLTGVTIEGLASELSTTANANPITP
ncbi:hypothetical protein [Rhodococcus sp. JT-3]|uniref:hypothetical protein n=1 Tax=Rhodococcus sp. JT-3 TaxID=1973213 RepID=UPI0013036BC3|nr:hypothetical protein [Rhodococcus sp. JT-3]